MLSSIERATGQVIERMNIPSATDINQLRVDQFKKSIMDRLENNNISFFQDIIEDLIRETQADPIRIAAALAHISNGNRPFLLDPKNDQKIGQDDFDKNKSRDRKEKSRASKTPRPLKDHPDIPLLRYRVDVGYKHGVKPGNIVGAIANTADLDSEYIGQIDIYNDFSTVDLPAGMLSLLQNAHVANRPLAIRPVSEKDIDQPATTGRSKKRDTVRDETKRRSKSKDSSTKERGTKTRSAKSKDDTKPKSGSIRKRPAKT